MDLMSLSYLDSNPEEIALEKMVYSRFNFYYTTWKLAQFSGGICKLDDSGFQFPTDSVVHLLSYMDKSPSEHELPVIPEDIFNIPPFMNEIYRKYIYHNTNIVSTESPFYAKHMSIYRTVQFQKDLIEFRRHRSVYVPIPVLESGMAKPNSLIIINHCPLWRAKVIGAMGEYKKFDLIMRSIFDFLLKYMKDDKHHFLYVPLSNRPYLKPSYRRAIKEITRSTLAFNDDMSYYFLIHLYGYLYKLKETPSLFSVFDRINSEKLGRLHLMLVRENNFICYKLSTLMELLNNAPLVLRAIKQINLLKLSTEADFSKKLEVKEEETSIPTSTKQDKKETKEVDYTPIEILSDEKEVDKYIEDKTKDLSVEIPDEDVDFGTEQEKEQDTTSVYNDTKIDFDIKGNLDDWVEEIDRLTDKEIDNKEDYTTAQKTRMKRISKQYKTLTLNGKNIGELLDVKEDKAIVDADYSYLKGDDLPDTSMSKSSVIGFDQSYMKKNFDVHLAKTLTCFSKAGYYLTEVKEEKCIDQLNQYTQYKVKFTTIDGKVKSGTFKVPIIKDDDTFTIGGVKMFMKKQMVSLPIVKIAPTKVSLSSAYNKALVSRNDNVSSDWLANITKLLESNKNITVIPGSSKIPLSAPMEYVRLGTKYVGIKFDDYNFSFEYDHRHTLVKKEYLDKVTKLETELKAVLLGTKGTKYGVFIDKDNILHVINLIDKSLVESINLLDLIERYSDTDISCSTKEFIEVKLLDKALPAVFILGFKLGLSELFKKLKVNYRLVKKGTRLDAKASDVIVRFNDVSLVVNRYPLRNSMILAGLNFFDTKSYDFEAFDTQDIYYSLLTDKGMSLNYIVGIEDFYQFFFMDPMTEDILVKMKEPTDVSELFIRACEMLTDENSNQSSAVANHRLRGYERINAIIYNELSRSIAANKRSRSDTATSLVNPEAILQRIIQDPATVATDSINPIQDVKNKTSITFSGIGGRTDRAFVNDDRRFPDDGVGVLAGDVPDGPKVGINAFTSIDPNIDDTTGMFKKDKTYEPANVQGITELLFPGNDNNDAKRRMMSSVQSSHVVPCLNGEVCRIRTGAERAIAHQCNDEFAHIAKEDGIIIDVNDSVKLAKIKYKSGTIETIDYKNQIGYNSGVEILQTIVLNVRKHEKVKRGDVLAYNAGFFVPEYGTKQVLWKQGVFANMAFFEDEDTHEDGSAVSLRLNSELSFDHVTKRKVKLRNTSAIHEYKWIGDTVSALDVLCVTEAEEVGELAILNDNQAQTDSLIQLNRKSTRATVEGTIIDIQVYYSCPIQDMNKSVASFVRKVIDSKNKRASYAEGTSNSINHIKSDVIEIGSKYRGTTFYEDTVLIEYFIAETIAQGSGDKVVIDACNKTVTGHVYSEDEQPMTESGLPIDMVYSEIGVMGRIVLSPKRVGWGQRILMKVEEDITKDI